MPGKLIVRGALTARPAYLTEDESRRLFTALGERDEELKRARERSNKHRRQHGHDLMSSSLNIAYVNRRRR